MVGVRIALVVCPMVFLKLTRLRRPVLCLTRGYDVGGGVDSAHEERLGRGARGEGARPIM